MVEPNVAKFLLCGRCPSERDLRGLIDGPIWPETGFASVA